MVIYFPRRWHYGLVAVLLLSLVFGLQTAIPNSARADILGYSQMGRVVGPVANYGSWSTIGTTQPYVPQSDTPVPASFEWTMTYNFGGSSGQHFVQTGWVNSPACGSSSVVYWEYYDGANYTHNCTQLYPSYDNDYANQYNPRNGWWCNSFNGNCINSEPSSVPALTTSYYVANYGETNYYAVQMGGQGQSNAIYLTNLRYFDTSNNPQWITDAGSSYGNGCVWSPCPYGTNYGFSASVLFTYNWTY